MRITQDVQDRLNILVVSVEIIRVGALIIIIDNVVIVVVVCEVLVRHNIQITFDR